MRPAKLFKPKKSRARSISGVGFSRNGKAEWHELYNSPEWRAYSKDFRIRNPLCIDCLENNVATPTEVTDHIKPHRGDLQLFWDPTNHAPRCKRCHDRKTSTVDGGGVRNLNRRR
jgi:5-methylcytosine-specific restriction endonuclease McrA